MTDRIALDTSIVIEIFRRNRDVQHRFQNINTFWLPVPVIAEMRLGFVSRTSESAIKARTEFEAFILKANVIDCTTKVAAIYAEITYALREKGLMIPLNDIWIAACCLQAQVPLATRDTHYQRIPSLDIEMW